MRARYLYQWFPEIMEEELDEVEVKKTMSEFEQDMMKNELGIMMFGDVFDTTLGNPELPSIMAGQLGSKVKEWKKIIKTEKITKIE